MNETSAQGWNSLFKNQSIYHLPVNDYMELFQYLINLYTFLCTYHSTNNKHHTSSINSSLEVGSSTGALLPAWVCFTENLHSTKPSHQAMKIRGWKKRNQRHRWRFITLLRSNWRHSLLTWAESNKPENTGNPVNQ